jgi:hypothetical protein
MVIKTANIAIATIAYDFKLYYFKLLDTTTNSAVGVSLNVSSQKAVLNTSTGYFYYDTLVAG